MTMDKRFNAVTSFTDTYQELFTFFLRQYLEDLLIIFVQTQHNSLTESKIRDLLVLTTEKPTSTVFFCRCELFLSSSLYRPFFFGSLESNVSLVSGHGQYLEVMVTTILKVTLGRKFYIRDLTCKNLFTSVLRLF